MGTNVQDVAARAKQLISERKYREAVRACRRVLLSKPDSVEVRLLLAQALLALGRHDEVRIEMQTLTRRSPSTGAAHRLLGEAYLRAGNKIDATRSLKQALLLDASDEEARELLEELDEVESPPMDTIDRWFGEDEPQTVEMSLDAHAPPATPPDLPNEPTVQVDPGIVGESKPAPRQKRTMIGMQAVTAPLEAPSTIVAKPPVAAPAPPAAPTAPKPISALAPTSPLPPQATATGRIRQRPGKRTMMGMPAFAPGAPPAPPVAPPPAASPPAASPAVPPSEEELASEDLMLEEAPAPIPRGATKELDSKLLPSSTEELSAEDLAPLASGPLAPSSTEELSAEDLAPLASRPSSTEELSDGDLSPLPPLEGEATQALLPSGLDALDDVPTHARPEEKTRTRSPSIADVPDRASFEDATHAARPGAKAPAPSFPSDPVEGPPGTAPLGTEPLPGPIGTEPLADVPLLSGEATRVPSEPIGLPPSAPASVPGPLPAMPSDLKPSRQPTGPMPVATPEETPAERAPIAPWQARLPAPLRTLPPPVLIALAGVPVLLLVAIFAGVRAYQSSQAEEAIAGATLQASLDGSIGSLNEALRLDAEEDDDDPPAIARRARLQATALLEHGFPEASQADAIRMGVGGLLQSISDEPNLTDATIAQVYLALEAGQSERALALLGGLPAGGEASFAAARAHFLVGDLTSAEASAGQLDPSLRSGPRYASLLALILASKGQTDGALAVFDRVARMEESSVARVARAEVHRLRGDADATFADAQQVYEESNDASLRQKAWAHLLLAEAKWLGRNRDAATQLGAALSPIARDERFVLRLITLLRQVGALDEASAVVNALPEAAMRPGERSLVLAELALAKGDLDGAAQAVAQAPAGAQQAYLQGRLAEARNDLETAVARYQTAAEDEAQFVRAKTRLGVIALAQGELDDAIAHLQAARPNDPASEAIVVPLVDALLAKGSNDDALGAVTEALAADGDSVALLVAKAKVDLAKGDAVAALRALDPLAEGNPDDAALQATFGEAARRTGTRAKAEAGFANALRVQPRNQVALAGTVRLAIDGFDLEAGNAAFAAAREGGVPRRVLTLLEGRLLVMQGAGRRAVSKLRPLAERRRGRRWRTVGRDPEVWAAYGVALAQAEDDRNASRVLERAISYDGSVVDARLALAAVRTRRGDLTGASRLIGDAERLIESRRLGAFYEAWVLAARGRIMYENGNIGEARRLADEAIAKDPASAPGLFLLGIVEDADGRNAVDPLRRSLEGHFPAPESLGQLIVLDRRARDRCDLVQSYLARAPTGVDSRDARLARRRCRR